MKATQENTYKWKIDPLHKKLHDTNFQNFYPEYEKLELLYFFDQYSFFRKHYFSLDEAAVLDD